jgi:diguanylate cyclase (GGDEF)-like protein/PAS domain S-box-containing protein
MLEPEDSSETSKSVESESELFDRVPVPLWIYDAETFRFLSVNQAAIDKYGYSRDEFLGMSVFDIRPEGDAEKLRSRLSEIADSEMTQSMWTHRRRNGELIHVDVSSRKTEIAGRAARLVVAVDVSERRRAEEVLQRTEKSLRELLTSLAASELRYRALFERVPAGIYRSTLDGRLIQCNPAFAQALGYTSPEEIMSCSILDFYFAPEERAKALDRLGESRSLAAYELKLRRKDGSAAHVLLSESLVDDEAIGEPVMEGTLVDITERKAAEELAQHQAYHDALTGLANRWLFKDRLSTALSRARRHNGSVSVLLVGVDHFKRINDAAGYAAGDMILREVAARITESLRHEDSVARQGGDEFLVLLPDVHSEEDLARVASKLINRLAPAFGAHDQEVFLTASIGIASFPDDSEDPDSLIRHAHSALYRAKEAGGATFQYYTPSAQVRVQHRLDTESALRHAIERDELIVHYQPQLDLRTGGIVGAEALVRWQRGDTLVPPADFIPVAEEAGIIVPIGEWILRKACTEFRALHQRGFQELKIAVNLSARQFNDPNLLKRIEAIISETGIDPKMLEVEITETLAMQDLARTQRILNKLEDLGVRISLDDFGTGYSSLNYLRLLPIQTVKIDRLFVADICRQRDRAIIRAIVDLAHSLSLKVLAEGVETEEQKEILTSLECDEMQGFLFSKAVPRDNFTDLLSSHVAR